MDPKKTMPPAMLLCGGQGTRLRDVTEVLPKPMVPVGSQPIVWHIMKNYAAFGVKRFILCLGYQREVFINYFMNYHARATDITIRLGQKNQITYHGTSGEEDWEVTLVDTGDKTMTGGRVARAAKHLADTDKEFFLTYGDAVSDVNISALLEKHRLGDKFLTVTAVRPAGRFGEMSIDIDKVVGFHEKPQTQDGFINGGFMVIKKQAVSKYLSPAADLVFEQEPMHSILADGEMQAYKHDGYWQCMDTPREHALLNKLWDSGCAPWTKNW
jgi:glucose-1-phosphate cytidylyltransferase